MDEKKLNHQFDVKDLSAGETPDTWANFKEKLEAVQTFPGLYTYKFILTAGMESLTDLRKVLPEEEFLEQPSKTGKYLSITVKKWMLNADAVIEIYKQASAIKGIMML